MKKRKDMRSPRRSPLASVGKLILGIALIGIMTAVFCASALGIYAVNYAKTVSKEAFTELAEENPPLDLPRLLAFAPAAINS